MIDEELYQKATQELNSEQRRPDLWARAVALASDDHDEARYLYTNLRVEELLEAKNTGNPVSNDVDELEQALSFDPDNAPDSIHPTVQDVPPVIEPEAADQLNFSTDQELESPLDYGTLDLTRESAEASEPPQPASISPESNQSAAEVKSNELQQDYLTTSVDSAEAHNDWQNQDPVTVNEPPVTVPEDPATPVYGASTVGHEDARGKMSPNTDLAFDDDIDVPPKLSVVQTPSPILSEDIRTEQQSTTQDKALEDSLAAEFLETTTDNTFETDQTIRVDQPENPLPFENQGMANTNLEGQTSDSYSHEFTTNQTLNPDEENDGDINPRIVLNEQANRSSVDLDATEDLTPVPTGSRFYSVFTHKNGTSRAVKLGLSWPAFFFTLPWLLYKKLWGTALVYIVLFAVLLIALVTIGLQLLDAGGAASIETKLVAGGFAILGILGIFYLPLRYGNRWVASKLERTGYAFKTAVSADSAHQAISRQR